MPLPVLRRCLGRPWIGSHVPLLSLWMAVRLENRELQDGHCRREPERRVCLHRRRCPSERYLPVPAPSEGVAYRQRESGIRHVYKIRRLAAIVDILDSRPVTTLLRSALILSFLSLF